MVVKTGCYPVPWNLVLIPFVIGPYARSRGTVGGTTCPTNSSTMRLAKNLLLAQSVTANSCYTDTWIVSHKMILPIRLLQCKTTRVGVGLWDDLQRRGSGRSIKPVVKSLKRAKSQPGGLLWGTLTCENIEWIWLCAPVGISSPVLMNITKAKQESLTIKM